MFRVVVFLIIFSISPLATSGDMEKTMAEWDRVASTYPDKNVELSTISKYAIMSGKSDVAEKVYLKAYNSYKNNPKRQQFVSGSLFQIFLVFVDKNNPNRDIEKANQYLEKLENEFSGSEEATKAREIYSDVNS